MSNKLSRKVGTSMNIISESIKKYLTPEYTQDSILLAEWDEVPEYLYTATFNDKLDSIADHGLGNKKYRVTMSNSDYGGTSIYNNNGFFLALDPNEAVEYIANDARNTSGIALIRVPKSILDPNKLYYDMNNYSLIDHLNGYDENYTSNLITYFYNEVIHDPTKYLELVDY